MILAHMVCVCGGGILYIATSIIIAVTSWWSVLLMEETGLPRENHLSAACHCQTVSHNVVSSTPRHDLRGDRH